MRPDDYGNESAPAPADYPRRVVTHDERELLIYLHGVESWLVREPAAQLHDGQVNIPGTDEWRAAAGVSSNIVHVFAPAGDTMALVHEYGHAIHLLMYPESADNWPNWKAEAFALLADVRAMKMKVGLTASARKRFAEHIRATRRDGYGVHRTGLKVAWRAVWSSNRLAEQRRYVVDANA